MRARPWGLTVDVANATLDAASGRRSRPLEGNRMAVTALKPKAWKGPAIRGLRRWFGLNQEQFAGAVGAHRATVIRWEKHAGGPSPASSEAVVLSALGEIRNFLQRSRGARAKSWLTARIPALGGKPPKDVLAAGPYGVLRVRDVVREDWEGVY